jgi:putative transposase
MEITVSRDRNAEFEPQLVKKRQRRLPGFDDKVIALYARGMTTREIQGHLEELYWVEASSQLISAVTDSVMDDVAAWQSRPLDAVYLALGITLEGRKDLLGHWIGESEGTKFWLSVMTELKNRGVQDVLIACVDGLKDFPGAIEAIFPKTQVPLCIIHMVRHSLKYVGWKERKAVAADLKTIYTAPTAEHALEAFERKWAPRFPSIAKSWRANWTNLIPFYGYPPEIRKVIYTTNAIESMQSSLRKMTRQRGAFPNAESVRKVVYLALQRISKNWQRPVLDWIAALNHFTMVFEGRIPA